MSWFVRSSTWLYRGMLALYPFDLRFEYGAEMASVFAEELEEAWAAGRIGDLAGVWWRALSEAPWVAFAGRFRMQGLPAPAVGMMVQLVVLGGVLVLSTFAQQALPHDVLHGVVMLRP